MTLGGLVDRLSVLNLKIWHLQDWLYEVERETPEQFARRDSTDTHQKLQQLATLNLDRNRAMTDIDDLLARAVRSGDVPQESRIKLT